MGVYASFWIAIIKMFKIRLLPTLVTLPTIANYNGHFAVLEYLRRISPSPPPPLNSAILPSPPKTMLDFLFLELAF